MELWVWLLALGGGLVGGLVDNVVGMGFGALSGTVMMGGGVPPLVAVATVNLAKVGTGAVSGLSHWRFGNVRWLWVLPLTISGVLGGVMGALLLVNLPAPFVRLVVPSVLLGAGVLVLLRFLPLIPGLPPVAGGSSEAGLAAPSLIGRRLSRALPGPLGLRLAGIGGVAGAINAISGAFGPVATASVILLDRGHPRYAVGTVNLAEFFVAGAITGAFLSQRGLGDLRCELAAALLVGGVVGAPLGAYLSRRLPAQSLGIIMGLALVGLNAWALVRALS